MKTKVSLEMGYDSGFASLGRGWGCSPADPGWVASWPWGGGKWGGAGDHTEGTFTCAHAKLGEIFLRLSQETPEKGIWGREKSGSQCTQERKHRACPGKTQGTGNSEEGLEVLGEEGDVPLKTP